MRTFKALLFGLAVFLAHPASAGPIEDGLAAYTRNDFASASKFWTPLAKKGDAEAQYCLGVLHHFGLGDWQNYRKSRVWYRKAAKQGHLKAQVNLGGIYDGGLGVSQDHKLAAKWYRKAADQGSFQGQYNLALMYFNGTGVAKSYRDAAKYFRLAADQGYPAAQFNLGLMHFKGQGVDRSNAKAIFWYRKAAELGDAEGHFNLGTMYLEGLGVFQNNVQAYKFFILSAAYSTSIASLKRALRARDIAGRKMTRMEKADAKRRAKKWWLKRQPSSPLMPGSTSNLPGKAIPAGKTFGINRSIKMVGYKIDRVTYLLRSR